MKIAIIAATAQDRAIGQNNQLLWHLPADLKRFKALTTEHSIIMGRRTFESLPNGALPNRRNIVISRSLNAVEGVDLVPSLTAALELCQGEDYVYIIGGGQVYQEALPLADELHLTFVEAVYPEADTYFPQINLEDWIECACEHVPADACNSIASTYCYLRKKNNK